MINFPQRNWTDYGGEVKATIIIGGIVNKVIGSDFGH